MTAPTERMDGDAIDPRVARVLSLWFEEVASATEKAYLALYDLGLDDAEATRLIHGERHVSRS